MKFWNKKELFLKTFAKCRSALCCSLLIWFGCFLRIGIILYKPLEGTFFNKLGDVLNGNNV